MENGSYRKKVKRISHQSGGAFTLPCAPGGGEPPPLTTWEKKTTQIIEGEVAGELQGTVTLDGPINNHQSPLNCWFYAEIDDITITLYIYPRMKSKLHYNFNHYRKLGYKIKYNVK